MLLQTEEANFCYHVSKHNSRAFTLIPRLLSLFPKASLFRFFPEPIKKLKVVWQVVGKATIVCTYKLLAASKVQYGEGFTTKSLSGRSCKLLQSITSAKQNSRVFIILPMMLSARLVSKSRPPSSSPALLSCCDIRREGRVTPDF